ncbi:hypothetical protein CsSME_00009447 [Camellia sinensis var. sinensis]
MYQLVYAGDVEVLGTTTNRTTGQCLDGTLSPELVKGKIVLCLSGYSYSVEKGLEVKRVQGIGFILQNPMNGIGISVVTDVLLGTAVFFNDSTTILNYIRTSKNPMATLVPPETVLNSKPAPFMHPSLQWPNINTAPGLSRPKLAPVGLAP